MAITGTKLWVDETTLYATDMNQYLMRGVKVYADAATRDAAYGGAGEPTLEEGEICYLADTNKVLAYDGSAWQEVNPTQKVRQVVQTIKTDTFSTTSATFTDVTGMTATITPSATSSKILVTVNVNVSLSNVNDRSAHFRLNGGNSGTFVGDAASTRIRSATSITQNTSIFYVGYSLNSYQIVYLDSPSTTSATTYALQTRASVNDVTVYVNRNAADTDGVVTGRGASSITVMEVTA